MIKSRSIIREMLDPLDVMARAVRIRHVSRWGRAIQKRLARWSGTQQARATRQLAKEVAQ